VSLQKAVVLVPSLGRPASDFAQLEKDLASAGFTPFLVEPFPEWEGEPTLHDLASAVVANLEEQGITQFHLVGHAFGNRLSRCITADFNSRVESLTLLAAGGLVEPEPHIWRALSQCYNTELSSDEHLSYVKQAFFADGNDPTVWRDGWMPTVMRYQRAAVQRTPRDEWWSANVDRVLVVQGLQDAIAPVENGRRYKAESAPHARLVEVNNAGHALLPEQPEAIAEAVLTFLSE
jgi:pimeloyl-ACP methyl ester carboxylesterase